MNSVTFLGNVLSKDGIAIDPKKTAAIKNMASPKAKELRTLLGMITFHPEFIQGFCRIPSWVTDLESR